MKSKFNCILITILILNILVSGYFIKENRELIEKIDKENLSAVNSLRGFLVSICNEIENIEDGKVDDVNLDASYRYINSNFKNARLILNFKIPKKYSSTDYDFISSVLSLYEERFSDINSEISKTELSIIKDDIRIIAYDFLPQFSDELIHPDNLKIVESYWQNEVMVRLEYLEN